MSLQITRTGLCDTIQDGGRTGYRHLGIGPGGAMDPLSAQLANALIGKDGDAPVIEMHFPAAAIHFRSASVVCLGGADFSPCVNGQPISLLRPYYLPANSLLHFRKQVAGRCCYLAVAHDLELESWLGSCSTHTKAGGSGRTGHTLQKGDRIPFKNDLAFSPPAGTGAVALQWGATPPWSDDRRAVRVTLGNEWNWLEEQERERLLTGLYTVSLHSDRMGYRLSGPVLRPQELLSLVSSPVSAGTIQFLPDGSLIALMADHQTTGGYPRLLHIAKHSLGLLAQKTPHEPFSFLLTDLRAAQETRLQQDAYLHRLKISCIFKMKTILHAAL